MSLSMKMKMTTLKGIFPDPKPIRRKNYIHENVKNLRRIEQCFQASKEVEQLQKLQLHTHHKVTDKYQNVSARVVTSFRDKKKYENDNIDPVSNDNINSASTDKIGNEEKKFQNETNAIELDKKHIATAKKIVKSGIDDNTSNKQKRRDGTRGKNQQKLQPKASSEPSVLQKFEDRNNVNAQNIVKYKSQGIQTLDTDEIDSIYSEGIIRYPSKETKHDDIAKNGHLNQREEETTRKQSDSPGDRGDVCTPEDARMLDLRKSISPVSKGEVDFVKLNKERISVANKLVTQLNNGILPPNYRKGVVPKYLRERKEAQQKEQKAKTETLQLDCPEGHVPLPDNERKETLRLLKKNYQDYVNELNMMPIKTDTLRAQRRKIEIEKQLNKLEEGIKVFSRPKVYVKINA